MLKKILCNARQFIEKSLLDHTLDGVGEFSVMVTVFVVFQMGCTFPNLVKDKTLRRIAVLMENILDAAAFFS